MFINSIFHSFLLFFLTFLCYSDIEWGDSGFTGFASEMLSPNGQTGGYLYIGQFSLIVLKFHGFSRINKFLHER